MILALLLLLSACGQSVEEDTDPDQLTVVATVYPAYDFARAVGGDLADVQLLLPPGTESHSYEPTPADILVVQDCDLFIYLGGESDTWVETILESVELRGQTLRMVDCVPLLEEETVEGMESYEEGHDHDHDEAPGLGEVVGYDEHVWTSPKNAALITRAVGDKLAELDPANADTYAANSADYAAQIEDLDREFADFFAGVEDRTMVFGDRFPLRYFAEEFNIDYYAAFPGCSTQTEPSAATIAFLTDKVREEQIPTVWYIEFSNHLVADSIAESAGVKTAMFHTCHNVSADDLAAGATYVSLMEQNLETLRENL
ncbi:MAG TPA: metal ABC transporter substrate-binding protein [Candidatus Oscillibacter excrementigallinarum]|uniref:Metal ABC transporter substrate-binding protein n=1 Tax=Candidatus Oscillibacter excrementigallinarum TaxID=2838716 RepID=A0A9D2LIV4_9FIRM|nr:metal ABC transporter substrate-binding protein [Candidatus Oscillibacter excrementigallinarum]